MRNIILTVLLVLGVMLFATEISFGNRIDRGMIQEDEITEASGLAVSGWDDDVLWTHNDSGGDNVIYALSTNGVHLGRYYLEGISFRDVEDIATGRSTDEGVNYIYLADVGDNSGQYEFKYIYRIIEPEVSSTQLPQDQTIGSEDIEIIEFVYEDGMWYDSETVFVDNLSGDLWIAGKRNPENPAGSAGDKLFVLPYPQSVGSTDTAEYVTELFLPAYLGYGITGGDLSSSGLELLLRTYDAVYYWERQIGESIMEMLNEPAVEVNYELELQGESICWSAADDGYYSCGEEYQGYPSHLAWYARLSSFIRITHLPTGLYKANEDFEIIWEPAGLYNQLYISTASGGEILGNYDETGVWGEDILISNPSQLGLSVGVYRGILHNPQYNYLSIEFPLIVESSSAPQMTYPPNGGTISDPLPVFQWQVNPGVPYYLLVVSDTPFIIEHDENGEPMVTGIETVWQAICYDTSLMYGMPDPSGYFELNAPPLISGQEYNWIVANNYGNDPLLTSKIAGSPHSFYYNTGVTLEAPELITPWENEILSSAAINFSWTEVDEAMYYQVHVFEIRQEGSNTGNYLVWDQVTTNSSIEMNAEAILISSDYNWKVYATSSEEISSVSETGNFSYDIAVGTLNLQVRDVYGSAVPFATAELDPIEGSSDDFPLAVNENGNENKTVPVGEYIIEVTKEGYERADSVFTINENSETSVLIEMEYSPSYFYGRVTDFSGYNLNNVLIIAENNDGEIREITTINGNYLSAVTPGEWTIKARKSSWICQNELVQVIESGENIELDDIVMLESEKDIAGYVVNTVGMPLLRSRVIAQSDDAYYSSITDENGYYYLNGVEMGSYVLSCEKPGYTALNEAELTISTGSSILNMADDLVLQPSAMINGTALNGLVGIKNVVITAVPAMGQPVETYTDEYGDYHLSLLAGNYYVGAYKNHYTSQATYQVNLSTGETLDNLNFILLPNDAYIRGVVLSEGEGLSDVQVTAGENYTYTDRFGEYELAVYPGSYNVQVYKTGYTSNRDYDLSLSSDQIVENIDFELYPNASIISGMIHHLGVSISSADVLCERQSGNQQITSTVSDADGEYGFSLLHGSYKLWAEKQNFACLPQDTVYVSVAPGEEVHDINIDLTPVESYINGQILNPQGLGIESALVEIISGDLYYSTLSGNYGLFSLVVEPGLAYSILVSKMGYTDGNAQTEELGIGENVYVEVILSQLPSTISGRVLTQTGNAIQGAIVTARGDETYTTVSSINGSWLLSVFADTYTITGSKPGYLDDSQSVILVPGTQIESLDLYLQENFAVLEGYVTGTNTGDPLEQVLITAAYSGGGGSTGYTDINGYYRFEEMLPGVYNAIIFSKEGYYGHLESNILLPGNYETTINIELEPYESAIRTNVTYMEEGMAGVTVAAENLINGDVIYDVTDEQGVSVLTDLASLLPYEVSVSKEHYAASDTLVYPVPGDTLELNFAMVRIDGIIYGYVRDQNNDPVSAAVVTATSEDGYQGQISTSASGAYMLQELAVNKLYTISVQKTGYSLASEPEIYLSEDARELDLVIYEHTYSASGILVDQQGITLADIQINCQGEITGAATFSGDNGEFELYPLAPFSSYSLWTTAVENGYENINWESYLEAEDLEFGEVVIPVHLSTISGFVTDIDSGAPLEGAVITAHNASSGLTTGAISQPDGSFLLRYLYAGEFQISAIRESYTTVLIDSFALAHREDAALDIPLEYNEPLLIGGVVQDTDGRLYEDVTVQMILGATTIITATGANGEFLFEQGDAYAQTIVTTVLPADDYDNNWIEFTTTTSDTTDIVLEIDSHNAQVSGEVMEDGMGLGNVLVSLISIDSTSSYITAENGSFAFEHLYEGQYEFSLWRPGYVMHTEFITLVDEQTVVRNIELQQVEGAVSGIVGSMEETALANAIVTCELNSEPVAIDTTNSGGAFQIDGLAASYYYNISVSKTGFMDYTCPDSVGVDEEPLQIELLPQGNSLSGTVYYDGITIEGASVFIRDQQMNIQQTVANEFGDYAFTNISGYYDVWAVYGDDLTSISEGVIILPGGSARAYLILSDAASIEGIALYQGELKPGVTVSANNTASGRWFMDITEEDGLYQLRGLPAGEYNMSYFCEGYTFVDPIEEITLSAGQDIVLPAVELVFMENSIGGVVQRIDSRIGISGAEVVLYDSLHSELAEITTGSDGTFFFSPLLDGSYYLNASHNAYEETSEVAVELEDGISIPAAVNFDLLPLQLNIYGQVQTDDGLPVQGAVIDITQISPLASARSFSRSSRFAVRSYSDTTGIDGNYQVTVDTVGFWQIEVSCPGYNDAQPHTVELSWEQPFYEQDFYLQPILYYADLSGVVKIWDNGWQAADSFNVSLRSAGGIQLDQAFASPDTLWAFQQLLIPDVFELEVHAQYLDAQFAGSEDNIQIDESGIYESDFTFTYMADTYSLYGDIYMRDSELYKLEDAEVVLFSESGDSLNTQTNHYGHYHFGSLNEGRYMLSISAEYDNENYEYQSGWIILNNNLQLDHIFEYLLAELGIQINKQEGLPLAGCGITVYNEQYSQQLTTNESGYCTTGAQLHSGNYQIKIRSPLDIDQLYLVPQQSIVSIDTLGYYFYDTALPLWLQKDDFAEGYEYDSEIAVYLHKNQTFAGSAELYYQLNEGVINQLTMFADQERYYQTIPPLEDHGELALWFNVLSSETDISYSSHQQPFMIEISSAGIPAEEYSQLLPEDIVLPCDASILLTMNIRDFEGEVINEQMSNDCQVEWSVSSADLGEITLSNDEPLQATFTAGWIDSGELEGEIMADIDYEAFHIRLVSEVTIGNYEVGEVQIDGDYEVANNDSAAYNIRVFSTNGRLLTLPWEYEPVTALAGTLTVDQSLLIYSPDDNYIGETILQVYAEDPQDGTQLFSEYTVTVFQMVTAATQAAELTTAEGCELILYDNMLKDQQTQARLYLSPEAVPPFEAVGTEYEAVSSIFIPNSNQSESAFMLLPGLRFDAESDAMTARWDAESLSWIIYEERGAELQHIDIFAEHYAALTASDELGIYDLKLLPNPFTPYDLIGDNMGLQIQFRLAAPQSRYVNISARVYTLKGELVRTIVKNQPFLKGTYLAGESATLNWDGLTDGGRMARNGRYILHIIAQDSENTKEAVKSIVLIK